MDIYFEKVCNNPVFYRMNNFVFVLLIVAMLDMNISQFMKSLGLEHLRDIFEREQVSNRHYLKNS